MAVGAWCFLRRITMRTTELLTIIALILGPILAIQVQKFIEKRSEKRIRKMHIFSSLMATRATPLAPLHVEALNRIDIDFYEDKKVKEAWKALLDNFEHYPTDPKAVNFSIQLAASTDKSKELLTDLLYVMACSLGYNYDKVRLKRDTYYPKGHGDLETENYQMRQSFLKILAGEASFPVRVVEPKE